VRLAAIVPLYGRLENTFPLVQRLLVGSSRIPDTVYFLGEREEDCDAVYSALDDLYEMELLDTSRPIEAVVRHVATPVVGGRYDVIPYSHKINRALDWELRADAFVYVDNGSMPAPEKFERMLSALEKEPSWGAVYCTQKRTGFREETHEARDVIPDGFGQVNFTQVMHRPVHARWTLDMTYADPDLADAIFWRAIARELGPLYPVGGATVLDVHYMPSPAANGLTP